MQMNIVYYHTYGNLWAVWNSEDLCTFLRFCTGSTICTASKITVSFNTVDGLARRPTARTCVPSLELSSTYITFPEFVNEFRGYLGNEYSWIMDAL